ncbi:Adenylate and Guanylate cyclase catalytic domain containing protein [Tritrichomonas foetus]|uniref:Adenylate and Guanylate cyclase catalytic domain containing protein n=1 Tax=Tritrichomonas foetus TaxID=1144522 RepID=A0A1J4KP30_9EUKA|nr:Adenylate and Guanylate cyclase catalytic domain containing protein [Tritrichomonas foetus]|eukprot:OHT12680.1 Adenylate and Guanylate cyclase catalytic domain containing protein [Tritrichomonas foetus]
MNNAPKQVEASALSRSVSTAADNQKRLDLVNGKASFIDVIFPLCDEMLKYTSIPKFLYYILFLFLGIQIFSCGFWIQLPGLKDQESLAGQIIQYFWMATFFSNLEDTKSQLTLRFIITTVITLLYFAMLIIQALIYQKQRRFIRWTVYLTRFFIEFIPIICLCPLGNFIGQNFDHVINYDEIYSIIFLAFNMIYLCCFLFAHYLMSYLFANTTFISTALTACWSGSFHFIYIVGVSVFPLLAYVVQVFASWMVIVVIILKLVFNFYICFNTTFLPFVHYHTNTIIAALFTGLFPLDIISLVQYLGIKIGTEWKILSFVVVFIVSFFIWRLVTNSIVKKVRLNLSSSILEDIEVTDKAEIAVNQGSKSEQIIYLTDTTKRQHYMNLGIHRSRNKAELYMRIGISNQCQLFLDWSLSKFSCEFHNDTKMLTLIIQYISFFPNESRLLNYFFAMIFSKTSIPIGTRFCLYQVHNIKGLRQSSASSEITNKLMEMKAKSLSGIQASRNFWLNVSQNPSALYDIRKHTLETSSLFREAIERWPNNSRMCEEYSYFLIECGTNFTEGLKIKHRSELIEQGKNFVIDLSFRSLVRAYPMYLKNKIMDVKGNYIRTSEGVSRSKSSLNSVNSQNSQMSSGTMDGELDVEIEEQLARAAFPFHRLRLAFQRALEHRKSKNNKKLKLTSCFVVLLSIIIIIVLYVYYYDVFKPRQDNMGHQLLLNHFRYGFDAAVASVVTHWAHKGGLISDELFGNQYKGIAMISPRTNNKNLQFSNYSHTYDPKYGIPYSDFNMIDEIQRWVEYSRESLESFVSAIVNLASSGTDVHDTMRAMISRVVEIDFCDGDQTQVKRINRPVNETLKTALTYGLLKIANLTQVAYSGTGDWQVNKGLCDCIVNVENMYKAFDDLTSTIASDQYHQCTTQTKQNYLILAVLVSLYFVISTFFLVIFLYLTFHELKSLLKMMSEVDKTSRELASQPFKRNGMEDQDTLNNHANGHSISEVFLYFTVIFYVIFCCAVFAVIIIFTEQKNQSFLQLNTWLFYGISRGNYMLESIVFAILDVFVTQYPGITTMIDNVTAYRLSSTILSTLIIDNDIILRGTTGILPCIGESERFDQLNFADDCHGDSNTGEFHDVYRCVSLDRGINLFNVLVSTMLENPHNVSLDVDGTFYHAFHLMNDHLMDPSFEASTIISELATAAISDFHMIQTILSAVAIVVILIVFAIFWYNLTHLDVAFDGSLQMLRRLPPLSVVSNVCLMNYLLNKKSKEETGKMTASKSVIFNAKDAVLCLNRNESIEVINKSVTNYFGYTPEQLLGQSVNAILPEENVKIYEQIELMRNGECPLTFETSASAITDDETQIPVKTTILGISDDHSKIAKSFVVIMRDETELLKQQQAAEAAKKQSEDLLYQILPRDIVTRLNSGETDISFVVPSASVIFVDIVKFSDYSSTLTPAQIMENLSMVFACFDNCIAKYPLMIKIKLIGDVYMAAANLFTPEEPPTKHATETVQFGLDVLAGLEEVNTSLDSSLMVRIGINTDGPLIGGVLGTDKPVFDIIGDTINVAARLQSNGIPGTVQISQMTYEAIAGMNFNVEKRGLIELKGKGKKMAYIVRPHDQGSFFLGAADTTTQKPADPSLSALPLITPNGLHTPSSSAASIPSIDEIFAPKLA